MRLRKLTREEKRFLYREGYNPKDFLRQRITADGYVFLHKRTCKELHIRR